MLTKRRDNVKWVAVTRGTSRAPGIRSVPRGSRGGGDYVTCPNGTTWNGGSTFRIGRTQTAILTVVQFYTSQILFFNLQGISYTWNTW